MFTLSAMFLEDGENLFLDFLSPFSISFRRFSTSRNIFFKKLPPYRAVSNLDFDPAGLISRPRDPPAAHPATAAHPRPKPQMPAPPPPPPPRAVAAAACRHLLAATRQSPPPPKSHAAAGVAVAIFTNTEIAACFFKNRSVLFRKSDSFFYQIGSVFPSVYLFCGGSSIRSF